MRPLLLLFLLTSTAALAVEPECEVAPAGERPPLARPADEGGQRGIALHGGAGEYRVRAGDNLTVVAARLGTPLAQLRRDNPGIDINRLKVGQALAYQNRHIVPPAPLAEGDAILVNVPQRMLFHYRDGGLLAAYPAAAGKRDWQTPTRDTRIVTREKDKTWVVPPSIQREMRVKGEPVLTRVPPGPDNPLGGYWLGLELAGYGIHGTNAPASVYGIRTHGCIRLQPEHIAELFGRVATGTLVRITYTPVLLFAPPDGPVWLEAHPDAYARGLQYPDLVQALAEKAGVLHRMDRAATDTVLADRDGLAHDVAAARSPQPPAVRQP